MPIYDNPNDANLTWADASANMPWMNNSGVNMSNQNVNSTGYNFTTAQSPVNYGSGTPVGSMNGGWSANSAQLRAKAQQDAIARRNAAMANGTYKQPTAPGYANTYEAAYGRSNGNINLPIAQPGRYNSPYANGDYRNITDYTSLMNGLNGLNPADINIDSTATMFTNAALSQYGQNSADQLKYVQQAGQAGVTGYQGVLNTLQGGVSDYLKNINQGAQQENAGINGTLNYYQSLANRNQLPGQNIMEQNIQGNTASALNQVRQFGGNSQGALGAITSLYGQQQQGMRDVGLSAANYQAQNQQNLAGYMGTVGAQRAGVSNRVGEAALSGAQVNAQGQQMLTQAQQYAGEGMANYYGNQANQGTQFLQSLMGQRLQAEQQQADLARRSILDVADTVGGGLNAQTQAENMNYNMNQVMPYLNYANYFSAMMGNQVNPNGSADIANSMYQTNNQNWQNTQAGWANAMNQMGGVMGNVAGQYYFNGWGSGNGNTSGSSTGLGNSNNQYGD